LIHSEGDVFLSQILNQTPAEGGVFCSEGGVFCLKAMKDLRQKKTILNLNNPFAIAIRVCFLF
jgi:hypothetical protein